MELNDTPLANRLHISFFGCRNAGKSSLVNAVTGQRLSVTSDIPGTTTDPVFKAMELLPLGPVVIADTPGFDDEGTLGELRVEKTKQVLRKTDLAILVVDAVKGMNEIDRELIQLFDKHKINYLIAINKSDLMESTDNNGKKDTNVNKDFNHNNDSNVSNVSQQEALLSSEGTKHRLLYVSAATGLNIHELKEAIGQMTTTDTLTRKLVGDFIKPSDFVVLVTPIDDAAPKGRLILPQQQAIRDVLEADCTAIVVKETDLKETLAVLGKKPSLVITDSQAFQKVANDTPEDIPLTSFSILMARFKGSLTASIQGVTAVEKLKDGDTILISEGCTHHRQCGDIGSVKLPNWLRNYTKKDLKIELSSGGDFPDELSKYAMIIHCGGCMLNEREITYRRECAKKQNVPFTNYGITIAYLNGILKRSLEVFPDLLALLDAK